VTSTVLFNRKFIYVKTISNNRFDQGIKFSARYDLHKIVSLIHDYVAAAVPIMTVQMCDLKEVSFFLFKAVLISCRYGDEQSC